MNGEPEPEWLLVEWVRLVEARWVAQGIPRRTREELRSRLLADLAAARAAGARIGELTATPPDEFADATAAGLRSRWSPISTTGLVLICLGAGLAAAGTGWLLLALLSNLDVGTFGLDEGEFYLFVDLFIVAAVLAVMVLAGRWAYRSHAEVAALTPRLAVALALGTLVGFPLASAYGARWAYSLDARVVGVEVVIVAVFLVLAVVAAQRWTHRLGRVVRR